MHLREIEENLRMQLTARRQVCAISVHEKDILGHFGCDKAQLRNLEIPPKLGVFATVQPYAIVASRIEVESCTTSGEEVGRMSKFVVPPCGLEFD